jgi:hypothetical protein
MPDADVHRRPPVVVGGVGGSGTRLIAEILLAKGYFLGDDLNGARDNLWFTLLFKRAEILTCSNDEYGSLFGIFAKSMAGCALSVPEGEMVRRVSATSRPDHDEPWLRDRAATLLADRIARPADERWGWKEPNTHIVLGRIAAAFAGMKYIFVCRHGLDMAFSPNQAQPRNWGPFLLNEPFQPTPRYSLRYWCAAHRRVAAMRGTMGERLLFLNYDDLCRDKERGIASLCKFLEESENRVSKSLLELVVPPPSIGRHALHRLDEFDDDDVAYVESLGFAIESR